MFVFGVFVDAPEVFDAHCLPGIAAHGGADATLITSGDEPVAATYNQMLAAAADMADAARAEAADGADDVEALVLLRQDATVRDASFRDKVRAAFASDDTLSILLPAPDPADAPAGGAPSALAGADGTCLVLHPRLLRRMRFDEELTGPHGHALDFCRRAREQGHRVAMAPLDVQGHVEAVAASARNAAAAWQGQHARRVGAQTLSRLLARHDAGDWGPTAPTAGAAPGAARRASSEFLAFDHPELVAHLPEGTRRVLDLGCQSGTLGEAITAAMGARVVGITDNPAHARLARTRLDDVLLLDLDETPALPLEPASFDVVVLAGLLERLTDPRHALELAARHLRPGGHVLATVPNVKHWSVVLPLLVQDRWEYTDAGLLARSSLRFFTMIEAAALFRSAGFDGFEVCAANQIPLEDPSGLDALVSAITDYGVDPQEATTLLNAYEYLVVAAVAN